VCVVWYWRTRALTSTRSSGSLWVVQGGGTRAEGHMQELSEHLQNKTSMMDR
jgi:hypothetical protein